MSRKKRVLWFSRHMMTLGQLIDLRNFFGSVEVKQISYPVQHAKEVLKDIRKSDIIALVAPLEIQKQFLELSDGKPVLFCRNQRDHDGPNGFKHGGWFRIKKIDCEFEPLKNNTEEANSYEI